MSDTSAVVKIHQTKFPTNFQQISTISEIEGTSTKKLEQAGDNIESGVRLKITSTGT